MHAAATLGIGAHAEGVASCNSRFGGESVSAYFPQAPLADSCCMISCTPNSVFGGTLEAG